MKIFRFYDTDCYGEAEYDIVGNDYTALLSVCYQYAATVAFRTQVHHLSIQSTPLPIDMKIIKAFGQNVDDVLHFALDATLCQQIRALTDSVFLPHCRDIKDLTFFRTDGSIFLASSSHNGVCTLYVRETEDISEILKSGLWHRIENDEDEVISIDSRGYVKQLGVISPKAHTQDYLFDEKGRVTEFMCKDQQGNSVTYRYIYNVEGKIVDVIKTV